jgi:hypothetical protein
MDVQLKAAPNQSQPLWKKAMNFHQVSFTMKLIFAPHSPGRFSGFGGLHS